VPVRPRRARRRRYEWSPRVALALSIGETRASVPRATLRAAWAEQRLFLLSGAGDIADLAGFWAYEPGVPDDLRTEPPGLYPIEQAKRVDREREQLHARRRAWLAEFRPDLDEITGGTP
jgi:hypothetical protein